MAHTMPPSTNNIPEEGPKLLHTNADLCAKWSLEAREVEVKGRGVFPGKVIPAGELVVKFEGPVYNKETCPDFSEAIQVSYFISNRVCATTRWYDAVWISSRFVLLNTPLTPPLPPPILFSHSLFIRLVWMVGCGHLAASMISSIIHVIQTQVSGNQAATLSS